MDIVALLAAFHGCARREELLAAGATWDQIDSALRAGIIGRRHRGVYALHDAAADAVAARVFRAQVGCISAARHWGIRELPALARLTAPHVIVPRSRSQSRPGLRAPWDVIVHRSDSYQAGQLWVPLAAALDQMSDCASPLDQLISIDGALHEGKLRETDLAGFGCGTEARREWLRRLASSLAESPLETITGAVIDAAGFRFTTQRPIDRVGRVDFVLEDGTVVETDGFDPHNTRKAFRDDRRRGRELHFQGRGRLQYAFEDVVDNPIAIAWDVARQLGRDPDPKFVERWRAIVAPTGMRTANPACGAHSSFVPRRY